MSLEKLGPTKAYISSLQVGSAITDAFAGFTAAAAAESTVDITKLPEGIVTGSNLLQFANSPSAELRSSVALSLLAAQRVATNDKKVESPDEWVTRHNDVLTNLNWTVAGGGTVKRTFESTNVAVHEAILPFLEAALGGAGAASLILTAVKQLKEIDANKPWITLFDRESQRFNVTEYQFSVVETVGLDTIMKIASARFDATYGSTQVLFFKLTQLDAEFESASSSLRANSSLLSAMNGDLELKLAAHAKTFIRDLDI